MPKMYLSKGFSMKRFNVAAAALMMWLAPQAQAMLLPQGCYWAFIRNGRLSGALLLVFVPRHHPCLTPAAPLACCRIARLWSWVTGTDFIRCSIALFCALSRRGLVNKFILK